MPLVRSYFRIFKQVKEEFKLDQKIRPNDLCQMKDVIVFKPEEVGMGEIRSGLQQVLCLALDSFDLMRNQEGRAIEEDFQKRINLIG
ncbi:MAG: YicC/YloC family endoribonuclease, partial [Desulfatiglandales bacterium]|nr:YicC/YloC family endoribonuclease [Desulfatiglandales bacterium]